MHPNHGCVPDFRWQPAPSYAGQGRIVIVAHPNSRNVVSSKADEPCIARGLCRARFPGGLTVRESRAATGPLRDYLLHHPNQLACGFRLDHAFANAAILPHDRFVITKQSQFDHAIWLNRRPAIQNSGIGTCHFDQSALRNAKRQRRAICEIALDPKAFGNLANILATHTFGNLDGRNVQGIPERLRQRHLAVVFVSVVAGAPLPRSGDVHAKRRIFDRVVGRIPKIKRRRIDKRFERRSGLPQCLRRAIERPRYLGIAPAHHRPYCPIRRHHDNSRLRFGALANLLLKDIGHGLFGCFL